MRYLPMSLALGALRRGRPIEQLLGGFAEAGRRGVRFVVITPIPAGVCYISCTTVEDTMELDRHGGLLYPSENAFYPGDADSEGARTVGTASTPEAAIELAERELNADPRWWVNLGMLGYEYRDYVARGRPLGPWQPS
ncbi:hypothetical protein BJY14_003591 [Actinomadura luteofluorescens]|uniref:Uncharacterized protein n=1 Tax=Actinomadura luteofluorescens TaxID=46163 RepID=A0A7Y9EH10_9ACTN|nr:hypothetical protein [Actinomadura luteofluorescens]NYD47608.1 hypothetical protein [Actinomadura luteofluorescens]